MSDAEDRDLAVVRQHVATLAEHFDTVQIFCTRHDQAGEGGTVNVNWGAGNFFARYGHVRMWVDAEEREGHLDDRQEWEK